MNAEIITIGDELLIGQVIDTNSAWIAKELNNIGVNVKYRIAVGDNKEDILNALEKGKLQQEKQAIIQKWQSGGEQHEDILAARLNEINQRLAGK